jgi:preprotein translocase subunit SecD
MSKKIRLLLIVVAVALAGVFIYPTINWYFLVDKGQQELANKPRDVIRDNVKDRADADIAELTALAKDPAALSAPVPEKYGYLVKIAKKNYRIMKKKMPETWDLGSTLRGFDSGKAVYKVIEDRYKKQVFDLKDTKKKMLQLGLDLNGGLSVVLTAKPLYDTEAFGQQETEAPAKNVFETAGRWVRNLFAGKTEVSTGLESDLDRAIEVIRNRIDTFGVVEPQIRKMNDSQILIEVPGEADPDRVNSFLLGKGTLSFHIIDLTYEEMINGYMDGGGRILENGRPADDAILPAGYIVRGYYIKDSFGLDQFQKYEVIEEKPGLDGNYIQNAKVDRDPTTTEPYVYFFLSAEGGEIFYQFTRDKKDKYLAVVMDDKIKAFARIQEPLRDQVRITGFGFDEANDLALILRTAAMPVALEVQSLQSVGPTLGRDTIESGMLAFAIGALAVFLFMLVYYKGAGINADLALILNIFFTISVLSVFNMTLTMTSIAGLVLNIGMAVDANVIIFERIKEEIRLGKSRAASIEAGFKKAFWTILDANITTFIAAVFLSLVGKGPIQGFAVTLAVGVCVSVFTALFVSRLLFDFSTDVFKAKRISIGWGLYK